MHRHTEIETRVQLVQKGAFAPVGFDEVDVADLHGGQDGTRKAGAAAEIDQTAPRRQEGPQLRGIEEVPVPQIRQCREPDQVDPRPPFQKERFVAAQLLQRFT